MEPYLFDDEPSPLSIEHAHGASDFVLICDHAGRRLPRRLGDLGLASEALERHIAWDIGIAGVGRALAEALDAFLITQTYSRLAIDCNRHPGSPQSIVTLSEDTRVPGNEGLSALAAQQRADAIFHPYHAAIAAELDARAHAGRRAVPVMLHSFTPVYAGDARRWHAGVLYHREARLARAVLSQLRSEPGLLVGENEPYAASEATDYALCVHGEQRGLLCVELEIRQDLIETPRGQVQWAERLARVLPQALADLAP